MVAHQAGVDGAQFNRDESRILTWGGDKTARLWDARTGQQIGPAVQHEDMVDGDESRILTWSTDGTARVWLLAADLDFPADQIELRIQAVTGSDYDFVARQAKTLDPERWRLIRERYEKIAADHAKSCRYPDANQWLRLQNEPGP
jgi:hypothetical protein